MRKYESIAGIHKVSNKFFNKGDLIHVSEKIDGANSSFALDTEGVLHFYSRNTELVEGETLRGFVPWVVSNIDTKLLKKNYIYYGEWVVKHKIVYSEAIANTFMLFDVFDTVEGVYLPQAQVTDIADSLGIKRPKELYYDEYVSLDHIKSFVGLGEYTEKGEGLVIRNETTGNKTKWVREDFQETKPVKQPKQQNLEVLALVESLITEARVEKSIYKGLDEGVYPDLTKASFGAIMKYVSLVVIEDSIKEEGDLITDENLNIYINISKKKVPYLARKVLDTLQ